MLIRRAAALLRFANILGHPLWGAALKQMRAAPSAARRRILAIQIGRGVKRLLMRALACF
jgi:hypothetical protein